MATGDTNLQLVGWKGRTANVATHREWLVNGLLYRDGLTLVSGGKGWGKTTFVVNLLTAVASGGTFLGRTTMRGTVLHFASEETTDEYEARLEQLGFPVCPDSYRYSTLAPADKRATMDAIEAEIERTRPAIVALDPVGDFLHFDDLNDYGTKDAFRRLKAIRDRFPDTHLLVTHHSTKNPTFSRTSLEAVMATVNGSVAVQSYFNQMFLGFGNVSGDSRDMWVWSRAGLKQRLKLRLDGGSRQLLHEPAPSSPKTKATRLSRQAKAAADWAAKANESWTRTELRDHVRLPSASETDAVLDELLQSGLIQIDPASDNSRAKHYRKVGDAR